MNSTPVLEMRNIAKAFGKFYALKGVDLTVYPGEIHALMGENGAGKSTLMKVLAGAYTATSGEILIDGKPFHIRTPKDALSAGITLIYQEMQLAPNLSVAENIFLGSELSHGGLVQRKEMLVQAQKVIDRLGAQFNASDKVMTLTIAEQQQVEIARALHRNSRILVMDEPTAALSSRETHRLFELIMRLRDEGMAIIYISHRMAEVYELSDRVSVLRDGQYVGSLPETFNSFPISLVDMLSLYISIIFLIGYLLFFSIIFSIFISLSLLIFFSKSFLFILLFIKLKSLILQSNSIKTQLLFLQYFLLFLSESILLLCHV